MGYIHCCAVLCWVYMIVLPRWWCPSASKNGCPMQTAIFGIYKTPAEIPFRESVSRIPAFLKRIVESESSGWWVRFKPRLSLWQRKPPKFTITCNSWAACIVLCLTLDSPRCRVLLAELQTRWEFVHILFWVWLFMTNKMIMREPAERQCMCMMSMSMAMSIEPNNVIETKPYICNDERTIKAKFGMWRGKWVAELASSNVMWCDVGTVQCNSLQLALRKRRGELE